MMNTRSKHLYSYIISQFPVVIRLYTQSHDYTQENCLISERETYYALSNLVYRANERGFYPRVKRIRTPTTTPQPPPDNTREGGPGKDGQDRDGQGKGLVEVPQPSGGCPYFFYYNTRYSTWALRNTFRDELEWYEKLRN